MSDSTHIVASFEDYAAAQRAVDTLSDGSFPVERLAVVGVGLRSYEQSLGRRGYPQAGLGGMVSGGVAGLLIGWLLGVFRLVEPLVSVVLLGLWGLVVGAVIGASVGLVAHALSGGRRDFFSTSTVRAERYDLIADAEVAVDARRALTKARAVSLSPPHPRSRHGLAGGAGG